MKSLKTDQRVSLSHWLKVANTDGIADARQLQGDYLVQYYNSLVGKEIKQLFQVMPWALEQMGALMKLRRAWHTQGALAAALHAPVLIRSAASEWRNFLNKLLKQFYMDMAKVVPTALSSKSKMHTISHAVEDVFRFGPLPLVSAERFESLNAVVRQASMLSNRKAPSRDIVTRLCDQEFIRNVITGTPYRKVGKATMFDTGTELRNFITSSREVQNTMHKFYGATPPHQPSAPQARGDPEEGQTQSGDTFKTGDIVMLRHELPADAQTSYGVGRVQRIFQGIDLSKTVQIQPLWPECIDDSGGRSTQRKLRLPQEQVSGWTRRRRNFVLAIVLNLCNTQRIQEIYKQQELQANALHKARNDIALLKKADAEEVQNMSLRLVLRFVTQYNLRKITTTFWFSGSSPGYSVGETRKTGPSKLVEDVAMQYFASDPSCLGSNGRNVLKNADGRDGVRKQVKSKLDGLRNATKKAVSSSLRSTSSSSTYALLEKLQIHDSLHKLSLLALAQDLFHYWEIAIMPSRLRRLALIRTWSLTFPPYHEEMNEDGDIVTESNRLFWPSIDQALAHLNADLADPARRAAARKFIDDAVKTDQDVQGTYNFDWDRHRPAQQDEAKLDRYFDASYDVVPSGSGHLALRIGSDTTIEASGSGSQMHQASYQREPRQRRQNPAGTGETDSKSSQEV
ncbi:hypothetical protein OC845_006642 [Tilletia horrida]|nr:hypothetical protein OC845_006642 [Tilletia horrida]